MAADNEKHRILTLDVLKLSLYQPSLNVTGN